MDFLQFGFPLGHLGSPTLQSTDYNHKSATQYPDHIVHYLQVERQHKAIAGPYITKPDMLQHTSPMMSRPKPQSNRRRIIIDLSWPHGHSVNDALSQHVYLNSPCVLQYPSIDQIAGAAARLDTRIS